MLRKLRSRWTTRSRWSSGASARDLQGELMKKVIGVVTVLAVSAFLFLRTTRGGPEASADRAEIQPDSVILNYGTQRMRIVAHVQREQLYGRDTVWVWAYFTNDNASDSSWSDAPMRTIPWFGDDGVGLIRTEGSFHWHSNPAVPRNGFHARVFLSATGGDQAQVYVAERDKRVSTMTRVITK